MSSICFLHVLVSGCVASFIRASSFIMSILFACMILFLITVYSTGMYPVSLSRMIVGMPFGRYRRVFITSLNMVCNFLFSSLPMVQPLHAYVIIGMMMASTICHIACIFIPLNSLLPVSEMILAVAPFIFLSISAMSQRPLKAEAFELMLPHGSVPWLSFT